MNLIDNVDFLWIASGYKSGSLFTFFPNTASSDLVFSRATSSGSRINSGGYVEFVAPHVPRLDFGSWQSSAVGCPFLKLESQRTNYIYSSQLLQGGTVAWASSSLRSFVTNSITAPDSSSQVCLVTESALTGPKYIQQNGVSGIVAGSTSTYSIFVKRFSTGTSARNVALTTQNAYGGTVYFTLEGTGSWYAETATSPQTTITFVSGAMIEPMANDWYRCSVTVYNGTYGGFSSRLRATLTSGSTITNSTRFDDTSGPVGYTGVSGAGLYLWGAQVESGSVHNEYTFGYNPNNSMVTSYISTSVSTQVTRQADKKVEFPSSSNPTNFTVFCILKQNISDNSGDSCLAISSGSTNWFGIWVGGNPIWNTGSGGESVYVQGAVPTRATAGAEHKLALRYSASLVTWFRDGAILGSQSFTITAPSWGKHVLGTKGSGVDDIGNNAPIQFRTVAVLNRGLTDAEAITLTT